MKDEETGFRLTFRGMVCDLSETFCPVMKGGESLFVLSVANIIGLRIMGRGE